MQNDNVVVLSVSNTGSDIDHDIMPKLFTKFTTMSSVDGSWTLYLKNIVEAHVIEYGLRIIQMAKEPHIFIQSTHFQDLDSVLSLAPRYS
jgi:hypothetical protein